MTLKCFSLHFKDISKLQPLIWTMTQHFIPWTSQTTSYCNKTNQTLVVSIGLNLETCHALNIHIWVHIRIKTMVRKDAAECLSITWSKDENVERSICWFWVVLQLNSPAESCQTVSELVHLNNTWLYICQEGTICSLVVFWLHCLTYVFSEVARPQSYMLL